MRRISSLFLSIILLFTLVGCFSTSNSSSSSKKEEYEILGDPFRLSAIVDSTNDQGVATYAVYAPYTDTFALSCTKSSRIVIYDEEKIIKEAEKEMEVDLIKDKLYGIRIETPTKINFKLQCKALNNLVTIPYDVGQAVDTTTFDTSSNSNDPLVSANVEYVKRSGGTYIYSNNPELIPYDAVGKAFIQNRGLTGDVFFTFEHANYSGVPIYLGYQLKNEGNSDVYVTVTNIGYQAGGTWFGQYAWYDYYNTSFQLPETYLNNMDAYSNFDYAYIRYTPRVFQPTTYRIPAGQYFYVIGGTTIDAYNNLNVDNSADKILPQQRCANGNVRFIVSGGSVTGTFYAYEEVAQVITATTQQGYRTGSYAAQYSGIAGHAGVIDNYMTWSFNDKTKMGNLPVSYTNYYDDNLPSTTTPYKEYNSTPHKTNNVSSWMTHLNPQNDHNAVGMDMVDFTWVDTFGDPVVIDNNHADGSGNPANTANWMIEYQDHFTFVNQGDNDRTITLCLKDSGTLAILVRDSVTGKVLSTGYSMGLASMNYSYQITIPAHSIKQVTLQYVLVACSYGNVTHWVSLV